MLTPETARIHVFEVTPSLPEPLRPLLDIAHNLWWSWHPEAVNLFTRLDAQLWEECQHNPVKMLGACPQDRLDAAAADETFMTDLAQVVRSLARHMERTPWLSKHQQDPGTFTVAYFCAEFGLTECLPIYSGGLGCLAGDHLKSAAELGLPMVAVGLLYRNGYFQQYLNPDGWQQEYYPDLDFSNLPIRPTTDAHGRQLRVSVTLPGREVRIAVWQARVGRVTLYLLDTNLPENDPGDRGITGQLYGGDMDMRIRQEIVLGIGGIRALSAAGIEPDVFHLNEGHSAFLALERIRRLIEQRDITFDQARQFAAAGNVFTTHTPVPAGIDRFAPEMIQRYFKGYHDQLRLDMEGLLALGRENVFARNEFFSMAVLAIRTADWCNGVSQLHGKVSRSMWQTIWPGVPEPEIPITHVTNGVHARSWLAGDLTDLLDRYIGSRWQSDPADQTIWQHVMDVPDEELWQVHEQCRQRTIEWTRQRLKKQLEARGVSPEQIKQATSALDPRALTIGFARRFATYKRGTLLLRHADRLREILSHADRPVQIILAGKSHPADGGGKDLIRQLIHFAQQSDVGHKIVFIENYDIHVARYLVQGCDIWLNTPRRGMEASGTSGMKAALNGVLHCSILDGWWDEAFQSDLGWAIGRGESYANLDTQDEIESQDLYELLQQQIIPCFYDRDEAGVPRRWVQRMKRCIAALAPQFNTNRMVQEYTEKLYLPSLTRSRRLGAEQLRGSIELASQKDRLRAAWGKLRIESVDAQTSEPLAVRQGLSVCADVRLDQLSPDDVRVQAYIGPVNNDGRIVEGRAVDLSHREQLDAATHRWVGEIQVDTSGRWGFAVRVIPGGEMFEHIIEPGLILWEKQPTPAPAKVKEPQQPA